MLKNNKCLGSTRRSRNQKTNVGQPRAACGAAKTKGCPGGEKKGRNAPERRGSKTDGTFSLDVLSGAQQKFNTDIASK